MRSFLPTTSSAEEINRLVEEEPETIQIVDVRTEGEFVTGHIKGVYFTSADVRLSLSLQIFSFTTHVNENRGCTLFGYSAVELSVAAGAVGVRQGQAGDTHMPDGTQEYRGAEGVDQHGLSGQAAAGRNEGLEERETA